MENKNIRSFRPSEEFQNLEHINQIQFVTIHQLQNKVEELEKTVAHLEKLLFAKATLISNK